jgi:hypothetical protein
MAGCNLEVQAQVDKLVVCNQGLRGCGTDVATAAAAAV